eukprot:scaffold19343_cov80-Cyclotella_meneghiniana.AAC.4
MMRRLSAGALAASTASTAVSASSLYWADMSIPTCTSSPAPPHLNAAKLFDTREACCAKMLPWLPSGKCDDYDTLVDVEDREATTTGTMPPVRDSITSDEDENDVDCSVLARTECLEAEQCEQSRKKMDNGLWFTFCDFKVENDEGESSTTTEQPSLSPTMMPTIELSTNSPTDTTNQSTNAPTVQYTTASPEVVTDSPTPSPSLPVQDNDEPDLYCASSYAELQSGCSRAPRCNNNPCPSGMFCFPYDDCKTSAESVAEGIVSAAMTGSLTPDPTPRPTDIPTHSPEDTPTTDIPTFNPSYPQTYAPVAPTASPSISPVSPYSTSDFIVEIIQWSNVGLDEHQDIQTMSSGYKPKTFSPTANPTASPSTRPTSHPVSSSPTANPTPRPIPTMELILPSSGDTTISNSRPNDNFGNLEAIAVNGGNLNTNSDRFDSLLKFDMSLLEPSYEIVEATMKLFSMNSCSGGGNLYIAHGEWDEMSVTWNDAPQAQGIRSASLDKMTSKTWQHVDITEAVVGWNRGYHNDGLLSFRIMSSSESLCMFAAGESEEQYRPELIVRYSLESPRLQTMSGSMNMYDTNLLYAYDTDSVEVSTESPATEMPLLEVQMSEVTVIAIEDASLSNIRQSKNFGTQNAIVVDGGDYNSGMIRGSGEESEQFDALIKFDVTHLNPQDIESSSLRIHVTKGW